MVGKPLMEGQKPPTLGFRVAIQTQGCKLNQAESEAIARLLARAGFQVVPPEEPADIYILNTCTVTHRADSDARQSLRGFHRRNPSAFIVATGCYAQRSPEELARLEGVGLVLGNSQKERILELLLTTRGKGLPPGGKEDAQRAVGRTRAMVKIQEGCNQVCSYCIVPKVRGRERSVPPERVLEEIRERVREGYKEVVLTGTQPGSYGADLPDVDLRLLLERILVETDLPRLRVSSLQPQELTPELLELWSDRRLCPHFHIPLQSGSDRILKLMRRRYTTAQYAEAVEMVRSRVPDAAITTDVMVGFPGEGEEEFLESLRFCEAMGFAGMHIFPFSLRPGTAAVHIGPKVDARTKERRTAEMLSLARRKAGEFRRRFLGRLRPVLWETQRRQNGRVAWWGLTDNYIRVFAEGEVPLANRITPALLVGEEGEALRARPL
jgi:threonylcarbamoyladenosine tRNA methylthiotransferase MtaB